MSLAEVIFFLCFLAVHCKSALKPASQRKPLSLLSILIAVQVEFLGKCGRVTVANVIAPCDNKRL